MAPQRRRNTFGRRIGKAVGRTIDATTGLIGMGLPPIKKHRVGAAPGIEHADLAKMARDAQSAAASVPPELRPPQVQITCIDYSPDQVRVQKIDDPEAFIIPHRPEWAAVRWINVDGLSDISVIHAL